MQLKSSDKFLCTKCHYGSLSVFSVAFKLEFHHPFYGVYVLNPMVGNSYFMTISSMVLDDMIRLTKGRLAYTTQGVMNVLSITD